jgi:membrane protein DedA with SNARE-associated domain
MQVIPPLAVYLLVAAMVGVESLGVPFPGETGLIAAALLSTAAHGHIVWGWAGLAGALGAVAGDSAGYAIGRRYGRALFDGLGRKLPRHFGPDHVAYAEHVFGRWGASAVFLGRWVALLRIFAGPLAGALRMPYRRFFLANAAGGLCWALGVAAAVHYVGVAAETVLSRFSYLALLAGAAAGLGAALVLRKKMSALIAEHAAARAAQAATHPPEEPAEAPT